MLLHLPQNNVPEVKSEPTYPHDCSQCRFLGSVYINQRYDVYTCGQLGGGLGPLGQTLIARFGPEGPEYASFDVRSFQQMVMDSFKATVYGTGRITHEISPWMQAVLVCVLANLAETP